MSAVATAARRRDLVRALVSRDVLLRYRGRRLGMLWSQISPIVSVVIYTFVFTRVIPLDIPNYPVFVFIGVEAWQWFASGLTAGTASVVGGRDLVRQPGFPLELLPFTAVATQLAYLVLALPVLIGAVVVTTGRVPLTVAWLPLIVAIQFALCAGCACVLAVIHVRFRDTADVLSVVLRLMFFVTPIIYDEGRLEGSRFEALLTFNPMAHVVSAYRDVLLFGREPDLAALAGVAAAAVVVATIGWRVYTRFAATFVDEI